MENAKNAMVVDALHRASLLIDKQKVVAGWSDKNQNKKREQGLIDEESARLRFVCEHLMSKPDYAPVVYRDESGSYRGRIEITWDRVLTWKERIFALLGGEIRFRSFIFTEGATGRVIQSMAMTVQTKEKDKAAEDANKSKKEESDELSKVMESEPLEKELRGDGGNDGTGGGSRDT